MRFHSLRGRIVVFFVLLLLIVQVASFGIINRAIENYGADTIREELVVGERIFHRVLQQNARQLALATSVLADDYGFRQAITNANHNRLVLALDIHRERMAADVMMLISPKHIVLADSDRSSMTGKPFPFPALIEESKKQGSASMIVANGGRLYQLVLVPVTVPAAWVALGFAIDDRLAADLAKLASLQVSFLHNSADGEGMVFASTLPPARALELLEEIRANPVSGQAQIVSLGGEKYQTLISSLSSSSEPVVAVLQRSLKDALVPFDTLQANLLALTLIGLGVSIAGSILTARNVTRPVTELAKLANEIEQGNYRQAAEMDRDDEIGKLAAAFNHMCEGIADREKRIEQKVVERTADLSQALDNLKESQSQLIQSEKMASLGQMVAGVAHEINTPLAYVKSGLEIARTRMGDVSELVNECSLLSSMLESGNAEDEILAHQFQRVREITTSLSETEAIGEMDGLIKDGLYGIGQISEIVVNLKNFSRLDRAKVSEFNVNDGLDSTLLIAKNMLKHKKIRKLYGDVQPVNCSPSQINQVFLNLISNAAQATDEDGEITLVTRQQDDHVKIEVVDNGKGIPDDVLPKIFDPFFTTKKVGEGTGLGLSIVQRIIKEHSGSIAVHSKVGVGTKFIILLPIGLAGQGAVADEALAA